MPVLPLFLFQNPAGEARAIAILRRMPRMNGGTIRVEFPPTLHDPRGEIHGGAFLRERRIALVCTRAEFSRIFVHEVAHFIWLRLGNATRCGYEDLLRSEFAARARGELGWSAEWRKNALDAAAIEGRGLRWREYCCESFCDTAAWLYSGLSHHPEWTLAARWRRRRRAWFSQALGNRTLSI